MRDNRLKAV